MSDSPSGMAIDGLVAHVSASRRGDIDFLRRSGAASILNSIVLELCVRRPGDASALLSKLLDEIRARPSEADRSAADGDSSGLPAAAAAAGSAGRQPGAAQFPALPVDDETVSGENAGRLPPPPAERAALSDAARPAGDTGDDVAGVRGGRFVAAAGVSGVAGVSRAPPAVATDAPPAAATFLKTASAAAAPPDSTASGRATATDASASAVDPSLFYPNPTTDDSPQALIMHVTTVPPTLIDPDADESLGPSLLTAGHKPALLLWDPVHPPRGDGSDGDRTGDGAGGGGGLGWRPGRAVCPLPWASCVEPLDKEGRVAATFGTEVVVWDTREDAGLVRIGGTHKQNILTLLPDEKDPAYLWTAGDDRQVVLWNWHTARKVAAAAASGEGGDRKEQRFRRAFPGGHKEGVTSLAFHAQLLYSSAFDGTVRELDRRSGKIVSTWEAHTWPVNKLLFVPRRHELFTASSDTTVGVWDARQTSRPLAMLIGHRNGVHSLALCPTDRGLYLASGAADGTVRVWDVEDPAFRCVQTLATAHTDAVKTITWASGQLVRHLLRGTYKECVSG